MVVEDTYKAEPMHPDCVACHALAGPELDPDEAALVLLCTVLRDGIEEIVRGLCFLHRRKLNDLTASVSAELDRR